MIKKISGASNALTWFEIPAKDIARARQFYETVLNMKMETMEHDAPREQTVFFPRKKNTVMALSRVLSGAIVKAKRVRPGKNGALIYLNASPSIRKAIGKVVRAGGKVVMPVKKIPAGLIAVIEDTEGNRIALHAAR